MSYLPPTLEQNIDMAASDTISELFGPGGPGPGPSSSHVSNDAILRAETSYGGSTIGSRAMVPRSGVRFGGSMDPRLDPRPRMSASRRVAPKKR